MTAIDEFIKRCEEKSHDKYRLIEDIAYFNQIKVLKAFEKCRVATRHFNGTSGYGYDDEGRDTLGKLYAYSF